VERGIPEVVISDPMRIRQVLASLLSNTVKFTDHGEMVVRAKSHTCDGGDFEAHFAIKDMGIDIPKERIGQIFLPFSQIDATVTRKYGGPGLGLVISKRLVVKMGRLIRIESTPGEGCTFNFTVVAKGAP
jgi:signal transduction histidine kinase